VIERTDVLELNGDAQALWHERRPPRGDGARITTNLASANGPVSLGMLI
jgi:hypothetical protein